MGQQQRGMAATLVSLGTASAAFSKWFLVWLFARSAGGPDAVGVYSSILAYATPIFVVSQLGLRTIFLSSASRWPWKTYSTLRFVGNVFGALLMLAITLSVTEFPIELGVAIIALKVCDSALDMQLARIQFFNDLNTLGIITITSSTGTVLTSGLLVFLYGSVAAGVWAAAAVSAMAATWAFIIARSTAYDDVAPSSGLRPILTTSVPVTSSQFLATLLFQIPILVLSRFADHGTVGVYASAAYLVTAAGIAGSTLQTLLITPFRSIRQSSGTAVLKKRSERITRNSLLIGGAFGVFIVFFGSPALKAVYGPAFHLGVLPLALLVLAAVSTIGAFVLSVTLTVLNRYHSVTMSMGVSCLASVVAGMALMLANVNFLTIGSGMAAAGATIRLLSMYVSVRRVR